MKKMIVSLMTTLMTLMVASAAFAATATIPVAVTFAEPFTITDQGPATFGTLYLSGGAEELKMTSAATTAAAGYATPALAKAAVTVPSVKVMRGAAGTTEDTAAGTVGRAMGYLVLNSAVAGLDLTVTPVVANQVLAQTSGTAGGVITIKSVDADTGMVSALTAANKYVAMPITPVLTVPFDTTLGGYSADMVITLIAN
ncbi:MAG: hypothetical protein BA863_03370 [Desulfovibrio sp. S3730MH75]|nr:MAG: hypothetical protein BA863_03370 [Desulfovibrio sp. S3730MH75]